MLTAALDCYTWCFETALLSPLALFASPGTSSSSSCLWIALGYLVDKVATTGTDEYARSSCCTPSEIEQFTSAKCTAIIRLLDFLSALFARYSTEAARLQPLQQLLLRHSSSPIYALVVRVCLDARSLGFDLNELDVSQQLPLTTARFLATFVRQTASVERLRAACRQMMADNAYLAFVSSDLETMRERRRRGGGGVCPSEDEADGGNKWLRLSQLLNGLKQLAELHIADISPQLNRDIFDYLIESFYFYNSSSSSNTDNTTGGTKETLSCADAKRKLLTLCLDTNRMHLASSSSASSTSDFLLDLLSEHYFLAASDSFFVYYSREICAQMSKRHELVLDFVLGKVHAHLQDALRLVVAWLEYVTTGMERHERKTTGAKIVRHLYKNWSVLRPYWRSDTTSASASSSSSGGKRVLQLQIVYQN